jgi:hypothetical protein
MSLTKNYGWYVENEQIAIVEPNTSNDSGNWQTITTSGKTVKIVARCIATDFDSTITDDDKTNNLPSRFRRMIADLAISRFYEQPPFGESNLQLAAHFYNKYRSQLKGLKGYLRSNHKSSGTIVPYYF